jgi:hypothetical protein
MASLMLSLYGRMRGGIRGTLFMDKFVARANIEHFRRKLAIETDEAKRQVLARLPQLVKGDLRAPKRWAAFVTGFG